MEQTGAVSGSGDGAGEQEGGDGAEQQQQPEVKRRKYTRKTEEERKKEAEEKEAKRAEREKQKAERAAEQAKKAAEVADRKAAREAEHERREKEKEQKKLEREKLKEQKEQKRAEREQEKARRDLERAAERETAVAAAAAAAAAGATAAAAAAKKPRDDQRSLDSLFHRVPAPATTVSHSGVASAGVALGQQQMGATLFKPFELPAGATWFKPWMQDPVAMSGAESVVVAPGDRDGFLRRWRDARKVVVAQCREKRNRRGRTMKLLAFHENRRPPFRGEWPTASSVIRGRRPLRKDPAVVDYEYDSDAEWEDEPSGDELRSDDEDMDEDVPLSQQGGEGDGEEAAFVVPDGYLSEEEGIEEASNVARTDAVGSVSVSSAVPCQHVAAALCVVGLCRDLTKADENARSVLQALPFSAIGEQVTAATLYEDDDEEKKKKKAAEGLKEGQVVQPFPDDLVSALAVFVHDKKGSLTANDLAEAFCQRNHAVQPKTAKKKIKEIAAVKRKVWAVDGKYLDKSASIASFFPRSPVKPQAAVTHQAPRGPSPLSQPPPRFPALPPDGPVTID